MQRLPWVLRALVIAVLALGSDYLVISAGKAVLQAIYRWLYGGAGG